MPITKSQMTIWNPMTDRATKDAPNWRWAAAIGIVGLYSTLAYLIPPGADTLWRLHIAQGLLDGQVLYRDMIEVNPPLWFWGAIPAAALGGYSALVVINLLATAAGVVCFSALVDRQSRWAGALSLLGALLLVSVGEIGQREQAFLMACALWSALAAARIEGRIVPLWLVAIATCLAAYGFALKHYFVLVPVILEAAIIWHKRRQWRPFRLETVLLAFLAMLYGAAVIYLTPDFLGRVLGLVQASYYGFGPWNSVGPVEKQVRLILQCAFVGIAFVSALVSLNKSVLVRLLLLTLVTCALIVLMQQKGWRYHLIAANGVSIVIMGLIWQGLDATSPRIAKRFVPLGLAALIWMSVGQPALSNLKTHGQPLDPVLATIIAKEGRDKHIAILSTAPDNAFFPLARAARSHWSRHYSMWMMPGLLTPQTNAKRDALRLEERSRVLAEFVSDLMCRPPDLIVGEVGYFRNPEPKLFDAMAFLREDAMFKAWLAAHYQSQPAIESYPIWRLMGPKPAPENCPKPR
jgi:hypothetical protein